MWKRVFLWAFSGVFLLAIGCSDLATGPELATQERAGDEALGASKGGPPATATVQFGRPNVGSPFQPPENLGHDRSTHAVDALQPRTVVISRGGTVTFNIAPFHKIAIYAPGVGPKDVDVSMTEGAGTPFPFPPIINDDAGGNRIARGDLVLPGPSPVSFSHTFEDPGRYLVICEVLPHFADNDMYGWVIVK